VERSEWVPAMTKRSEIYDFAANGADFDLLTCSGSSAYEACADMASSSPFLEFDVDNLLATDILDATLGCNGDYGVLPAFAEVTATNYDTSTTTTELGTSQPESPIDPAEEECSVQQNGAAKRIKREKPLRGVVRKPWTPAEEVLFSKALAHFGPKDVETNPITGRVSIHLGSVSSNAKKSRFERSNIELNVAKGVLSPLHHVRRRVIDL